MATDQAYGALLERFIERTAEAMLARGWEVDPAEVPDAKSAFLGTFRQSVGADWLATVEFMLESGPTTHGIEVGLSGPRSSHEFRAVVGGELGIRHLPTERLLSALDARCEADISLDLEDIFEDAGKDLPTMTDPQSVDRASEELVTVADAHAKPFARQHADVDAVIAFIADGEQANRDREFEYLFVPALLASSGRHAEARAALADFRRRPKSGPADEQEYDRFAHRLSAWLDGPSDLA